MRFLDNSIVSALEQRAVKIRDFVWFTVRDRSTGGDFSVGYWSDVESITAEVVSPKTQQIESRNFSAAGTLISISPIPLVSNLTVQNVTIELSQVSDANLLIRQYDAKQGRVEIFRGLFELDSMLQVGPAFPRFFGFIDGTDVSTPKQGADGAISLSCVSHTQELTRYNPATRSDAWQRRRGQSDDFRKHAATVGSWEIKWGEAD